MLDPREPNLDDTTFHIPCFLDPEPLLRSIERIGIVHRPVLLEHPERGVIVVLGRRRLQAARQLGMEHVQVRLVDPDMPEADGFALAFWDNCTRGAFDPTVTAFIVKRLLELFPREEVAQTFLPVLRVPPKGPRIERLRTIGGLELSVLEALAMGRIQEKTAAVLAEMDAADRHFVLRVMDDLRVNANMAAELVANLFDLSILQDRSVKEMLDEGPARCILSDLDVPTPQRAARLRALIRSWKYPELVGRETAFREWCQSMAFPPNIRVLPSQAFESDQCTIEITVSTRDDARHVLRRLQSEQG